MKAPAGENTEANSAIVEGASASTQAQPKVELSEEDQKKLRQLMLDLRWLITEGYVTEYGDGRLFAPPPMPEAKPKEPKAPKVPAAPEAEPEVKAEVKAEPEAEAKAEVAAETELVDAVEALKAQAVPETVIAEAEEPKFEAPVVEAKADEATEEKKS